jgi:UDP-3-O-[3-hydroxymyristoyl] N-acetylglucosamine deacetylase
MRQRTIDKPVEVVGIGLHKGGPVRLRLEPLDVNAGILFYREDIGLNIPLSPEAVIDTRMATVIGNENGSISTIEHFLSAVYAYGIDNLRIVVDGNEMPVMDGSAISFCLLIEEAGVISQNAPKKVIRIKKPVEITDGEKYVRLLPAQEAAFDFTIDFDHPVIGRQSHRFVFGTKNFVEEIARARTFGFAKDIQYLQSQNLALGASLQNAIGLDEHKVLNPEGLRFENEFVRHKILDAMGDLMVSGYNVFGRYESLAGSHRLNYELTSTLMADKEAYEIISVEHLPSETYARAFAYA